MSVEKLPEEWVNTTIANISVKCSQRVPNENDEFIYVDIGSINRDLKIIENPQYLSGKNAPSRARKVIKSGDVIVSLTRPNLNAVALVNENYDDQIASTGFEVIHPVQVESRYVFGLVRSRHFIDSISGLVQGALYPAAKSSNVQSYEFPLPPLAEQKIITEKLDTLLAQVDSTKARLEQIPKILKRFRQAVLTSAVNGLLTEEWHNTVQELSSFKEIKFESILTELRNGLSSKPNENGLGHPILRISSVRSGHVEQSDIRYLECSEAELERHTLKEDDLLFTRYNGSLEFVGVCGILKKPRYEDLIYPDKLIRARLTKDALPKYIEIYFSSPGARNAMMACVKTTSGQKGISGKDIKSQLVYLPSLKEQAEIVRRVEQLFAYADTIEKQVNSALARVNNLSQSILAKAFRGELTAQWRAENPELISGENSAAALLEKIKAERAASSGKKASRKKS